MPFLYDMVNVHALEWPSLTVQWLPDQVQPAGKNYRENRCILGTHTADDQNYLMIAKVSTPVEHEDAVENRKYDEYTNEAGSYGQHRHCKVEIVQRINHDGEVNRARYMPQNPTVIATKGPSEDVLVFDYTTFPSKPQEDAVCRPTVRLGGHTAEGYGLCWNPLREGILLSAAYDGHVCMWDVEMKTEDKRISSPLAQFSGHKSTVEDVSCNNFQPHTLASVGDDKKLMIWDDKQSEKPVQTVEAHQDQVNAVSFSPMKEELLLTASADKTVALWDLRNLSRSIYSFQHHQDSVVQVQWSPVASSVFASASDDRRICVWDISRINETIGREELQDGPPELLFLHAGHTGRVSDMCWDPNNAWVMASTAADNIVQFWEMEESIYSCHEQPVAQMIE